MTENVEKKTVNFLYVPAVTKRQYGKKKMLKCVTNEGQPC